ncbi:hypothetical protein GS682_09065 [Nostoc sp. B(2019)]|nr:hypothetical protein [Nostoc sp. B(2019)]
MASPLLPKGEASAKGEVLIAMRVLLPNRSERTVALCPLDTRERRKALRLSAVIQTIAGRRRTLRDLATDFSPPTELFAVFNLWI